MWGITAKDTMEGKIVDNLTKVTDEMMDAGVEAINDLGFPADPESLALAVFLAMTVASPDHSTRFFLGSEDDGMIVRYEGRGKVKRVLS